MNLSAEDFLKKLQEKYPNVVKNNKNFWEKSFVKELQQFLEPKKLILTAETDPFKVDFCPDCKIPIVPGDHFCSNCGIKIEWRE